MCLVGRVVGFRSCCQPDRSGDAQVLSNQAPQAATCQPHPVASMTHPQWCCLQGAAASQVVDQRYISTQTNMMQSQHTHTSTHTHTNIQTRTHIMPTTQLASCRITQPGCCRRTQPACLATGPATIPCPRGVLQLSRIHTHSVMCWADCFTGQWHQPKPHAECSSLYPSYPFCPQLKH